MNPTDQHEQNVDFIIGLTTFRAESEAHREESLLGIDPEAVEHFGDRPTLTLGISFFISWTALISFNIWFSREARSSVQYFGLNLIPVILPLWRPFYNFPNNPYPIIAA